MPFPLLPRYLFDSILSMIKAHKVHQSPRNHSEQLYISDPILWTLKYLKRSISSSKGVKKNHTQPNMLWLAHCVLCKSDLLELHGRKTWVCGYSFKVTSNPELREGGWGLWPLGSPFRDSEKTWLCNALSHLPTWQQTQATANTRHVHRTCSRHLKQTSPSRSVKSAQTLTCYNVMPAITPRPDPSAASWLSHTSLSGRDLAPVQKTKAAMALSSYQHCVSGMIISVDMS